MKTFVISVASASERRAHVEKELKNLGPFEFFDAITPQSPEYRSYVAQHPEVIEEFHPVEVCCALSHQAVLRRIAQGDEVGVLLEDDIFPRRAFADFVNNPEITPEGLEDLSLYHFGGMEGIVEAELLVTTRKAVKSFGRAKFKQVIDRPEYLLRSCGYAVNPKTAAALVAGFNKTFCVADHWSKLAILSGVDTFYVAPLVRHPRFIGASSLELGRLMARIPAGPYRRFVGAAFKSRFVFNVLKSIKHALRRLSPWYIRGRFHKWKTAHG